MSQLSNPSKLKMDHKIRLILGCGYVGERIASLWRRSGDRVVAVTRSLERAEELEKLGVEPLVWDWLLPTESQSAIQDTLAALSPQTVLVAVSHAAPGHPKGLANLAQVFGARSPGLGRWIYLSTTGVFADPPEGSELWVDESSSVAPTRPGSINALEAELWLEGSSIEHVVLRPAGIYGPGRIPNVQPIREGQAMQVDPESYLNLIHVDDLAQVIATVSDRPLCNRLYCVSDGNSVPRKDYYAFIAQRMHLPEPKYCENSPSTNSRRRNQGNKRVRNQRLVSDHAIRFEFPDYQIGLSSLLSELSQ